MSVRVPVLFASCLIWAATWLPIPAVARAAPASAPPPAAPVLITGLQTGGAGNGRAGEEYIELTNAGAESVPLAGWKIDYRAASAGPDCTKGWTSKIVLAEGGIAAGARWTASSVAAIPAEMQFKPGLATAGAIRLKDPQGNVADTLAWGSATCGEGGSAPAPQAGRHLDRVELNDSPVDTGNNAADFAIAEPAAPPSDPAAVPAGSASGAKTEDESAGTNAPPGEPAAPLELSELLPDPIPPQTDAKDEFIELYNPTAESVDLAGYILKAGNRLQSKYTLKAGQIPAGGYAVIAVSESKLTLANAGGGVALFSPAGQQLGSAVTYGDARPGQSWALLDDTWGWTGTVTPGSDNVYTDPGAAALAAAASKDKAAQAVKATKARAAAKPKAVKAKAAAKPKASPKAKAAKTSPDTALLAGSTSSGGFWLLFTLAGLTIAYIIYEFRYDIRNFYYKLRGYPGVGRPVGETALGRGDY